MVYTPTRREDILIEVDDLLDGSGNYDGAWFESSYYDSVRIACRFNGGTPTVLLQEGIYTVNSSTPKVIREQSIPVSSLYGYLESPLTARYFKVKVSSGLADNLFQITVRNVSA